jgi:hypothetical protein
MGSRRRHHATSFPITPSASDATSLPLSPADTHHTHHPQQALEEFSNNTKFVGRNSIASLGPVPYQHMPSAYKRSKSSPTTPSLSDATTQTIRVQALEEFPYNTEFVGRNYT